MLMHATMAALAVFICFAGNYLTGQSMMERPLVVGLVTGILMGDMKTGILMGASLEAVFLGNVNIGGVIAAEPVTATTLATTFAIISNVEQKAAMTLAVPIGMLAAFVVMFLKNVFMNIFAPALDKAARENNQKMILTLHFGTWVIYYLIIASISFIGILAGSGPINSFVEHIPQSLMNGLSAAGGLLPAVGFAMLMKLLWDNKLAVFYILGFVLTAYLQLPAVAVAVIGVVICVVSAQRDIEIREVGKNGNRHDKGLMTKAEEEEDFSHEIPRKLDKRRKENDAFCLLAFMDDECQSYRSNAIPRSRRHLYAAASYQSFLSNKRRTCRGNCSPYNLVQCNDAY